MRFRFRRCLMQGFGACGAMLLAIAIGSCQAEPALSPLPDLEQATNVHGGLCVVVGSKGLPQAMKLAAAGRYLVQILEPRASLVEELRETLQRGGWYGRISIRHWQDRKRLPYTEKLVNLLVLTTDENDALTAEVARVVCPLGTCLAPESAGLSYGLLQRGFSVQRIPADAMDWCSAYRMWPSAMDQWPHPRHGVDGNAVSEDRCVGPPRRIRWLAGPPGTTSLLLSARGRNYYSAILARDAFNGLRLWQNSLSGSAATDGSEIQPAKGAARPILAGELVVAETKGRMIGLDGVTGKVVQSYDSIGTPSAMFALEDCLIATYSKSVRAIDLATGERLWEAAAASPRSLVAGDGRLYFIEGEPRRGKPCTLVCLEAASGEGGWRRSEYDWLAKASGCVYHDGQLAIEVSTLNDDKPGNCLHMLSAANGEHLWSHAFAPGMAHVKQARALFVDELVWVLDDGDHRRGLCTAIDRRTGKVQRQMPAGWGHCFPPVATSRYLFSGEMHLTDLATGGLDVNRISKGACGRDFGFLPANGLIYVTPKECVCWPMLRDHCALAPARPDSDDRNVSLEPAMFPARRAAEGPLGPRPMSEADWPCYRHDPWRSGSTAAAVPPVVRTRWSTSLGGWPDCGPIAEDWRQNPFIKGPITPPVIAEGKVYVARPDAHQVVAMDASSGAVRWRHTANGRVDTPPTIHQGVCLFGVKSGEVMALRADDGRLLWSLRVGQHDEQIVAYGQLESPWPVPGSVLVVDGLAYFAAGRQAYADGGIRVFAVEPASGAVRWVQRLDKILQQWFYGDHSNEFDNFDLLHQEGDRVAMSRWLFDRRSGAISDQRRVGFARLSTGTLSAMVPQGSWSYAPLYETILHRRRPFRRPLVAFRDERLFGCSEDRQTVYYRAFHLESGEEFDAQWWRSPYWLKAKTPHELWRSDRLMAKAAWKEKLLSDRKAIAALTLAGPTLFAISDEGTLFSLSAADGKRLAAAELPAPVWDGLAAAGGRLFLSTEDGRLLCLEGDATASGNTNVSEAIR